MSSSESLSVGVAIGRLSDDYRGIPVCTRNIIAEFVGGGADSLDMNYIHYPGREVPDSVRIPHEQLVELPYTPSDSHLERISQEQEGLPRFQEDLGLDVYWEPKNRSQLRSPDIKGTPMGVVSTLHDVLPLARPDLAPNVDEPSARSLLLSRVLSIVNSDKVITTSNFSKQEIIKHVGVDEDRIIVIPNGVDHEVYTNDIPAHEINRVRLEYGLPEKYLLTLGSYSPHKNLPTLVKAYGQSTLPRRGYGLVMVGSQSNALYASDTERVRSNIDRYVDRGDVVLLDVAPLKDARAIFAGASLFAMTSEYEGFGLPPVEAMASGVPTVVSNTSSIPEVCGGASLYGDPRDSRSFSEMFDLLANSPDLTERMVHKGLARAARFNWSETASQVMDVIQEAGEPHRLARLGKLGTKSFFSMPELELSAA